MIFFGRPVASETEGEMLRGQGSRLFKMHFWHPSTVFWPGPETATTNDPMTPPPFMYLGVPEEIQEETNRLGHANKTWDDLEAAGIRRLYWRQPLKHLELGFWSDDVYSAVKSLIGDQLSYRHSFTFSQTNWSEGRSYSQFGISRWPEPRRNVDGVKMVDWFVPELCNPPLREDAVLRGSWRREIGRVVRDGGTFEYALPSWLDRGSERVLHLGESHIVTESFVERWRATDISKHLQEAPWESDFVFLPVDFNYRWVDVAVPAGIGL